jgi:hypothetical protein
MCVDALPGSGMIAKRGECANEIQQLQKHQGISQLHQCLEELRTFFVLAPGGLGVVGSNPATPTIFPDP